MQRIVCRYMSCLIHTTTLYKCLHNCLHRTRTCPVHCKRSACSALLRRPQPTAPTPVRRLNALLPFNGTLLSRIISRMCLSPANTQAPAFTRHTLASFWFRSTCPILHHWVWRVRLAQPPCSTSRWIFATAQLVLSKCRLKTTLCVGACHKYRPPSLGATWCCMKE